MPIVINSKFTPLTYDEITKPLIEQTRAQDEMENAYIEASDKAAELLSLVNEQNDPVAYSRLKAYSEDLQKQADALMSRGLQSGSRRALLEMRRRYGQDVVPLQKASESRKEWIKEQQQAKLKNPNLRFQRDAAMMSLSDIAANPSVGYGNVVDLNYMYNQAASIIKAIDAASQELEVTGKLDKYHSIIKQMGLEKDDIVNPDKKSAVFKAMESLYNMSGVGNWGDAKTAEETWNAINMGALAGMQGPKYTTLDNKEEIAELETNAYIRRHARINNLSEDGSSLDPSNPSFLLTPPEEYTGAKLRSNNAQVYMKRDAKGKAVYYVRTGTDANGNYTYSVVDKNNVVTPSSSSTPTASGNSVIFTEDNQKYSYSYSTGLSADRIHSEEDLIRYIDRITVTDNQGHAVTDKNKKLKIMKEVLGISGSNTSRTTTGTSTTRHPQA